MLLQNVPFNGYRFLVVSYHVVRVMSQFVKNEPPFLRLGRLRHIGHNSMTHSLCGPYVSSVSMWFKKRFATALSKLRQYRNSPNFFESKTTFIFAA